MKKYINKTWRNKVTAVVLGAGMAMTAFLGVRVSAYAAEGTTNLQVIANDETGIPDKALYQAVLEEGDSNKDGVLTVEEAAGIKTLDTRVNQSLAGIDKLVNLKSLWVTEADGKNIDISVLAQLKELKNLRLNHCGITDISVLGSMTQLESLNLMDNNIADISPVSGLKELHYLNISQNPVSDISAVRNLTGLTGIEFEETKVSDISALAAARVWREFI